MLSFWLNCFSMDIGQEKFLAYFWWCWNTLKACTFIPLFCCLLVYGLIFPSYQALYTFFCSVLFSNFCQLLLVLVCIKFVVKIKVWKDLQKLLVSLFNGYELVCRAFESMLSSLCFINYGIYKIQVLEPVHMLDYGLARELVPFGFRPTLTYSTQQDAI